MVKRHTPLWRARFLAFLACANVSWGASGPQTRGDYVYEAPHPLDFIKRVFPDNRDFFRKSLRREALWPAALVTFSTGLLIWKDQELVDEANRLGTRLRISHDHDQTARYGFRAGPTRLELGLPENWGQAMYFLGDGWLHFGIAGGFLTYGLSGKDNRALQTSSQMVESILASGFVVQILKHVTGRESPFTSERRGGKWRWFPNQIEYHKNVAKHDAFPSGHLADATASVTVITSNYPEYRFLKPISYTLLGVLSFQMMNNGVHWAGDYPLALALGYSFGKIAVRKGRRKKTDQETSVSLGPMIAPDTLGMDLKYRF